MSGAIVTGASFARGKSKQDYRTPPEFLAAVRAKFGVEQFDWDLAADVDTNVCGYGRRFSYFGPDHAVAATRDALAQDWDDLRCKSLWLNPPFGDIAPWAAKCAAYRGTGRIFFLVPASVGSNWWAESVDRKAAIRFVNPRICFDGKNPFPKDLALCVFGAPEGYECWRWK